MTTPPVTFRGPFLHRELGHREVLGVAGGQSGVEVSDREYPNSGEQRVS
ncbi:MAG: hypothetical protein ACRDTH_10420 [Pseudonocardiaceae bacterium]